MYINKIDDLLDKILDDFFNKVIKNKYNIVSNFVRNQKLINEYMSEYIQKLDYAEIKTIIKKQEIINYITEIIKRYLYYYFFLYIGYFFESKNDVFINSIVEFSRNQPSFNYKVENFFNAENNANIIEMYLTIKNIIILLESDKPNSQYKNKPAFSAALGILNLLGPEFVTKVFKEKSYTKEERAHNIVKIVIILELYKNKEKKMITEVFNLIEKEIGEYIFIDILVPKKKYLDYTFVQQILTTRELKSGILNDIWNFITESEQDIVFKDDTFDENILRLLKSGIVVPIVDDFLLYHRENERYDVNINTNTNTEEKTIETTGIKYIVSKIETTSELYSSPYTSKEKALKNLNNIMSEDKAIIINNNEDLNIIIKLLNQGRRVIENNDYFNDLANYRVYPYINFKDFEKYGFNMHLDKTIDVIRNIFNNKQNLQVRVGSADSFINIIGFAVSDTYNKNIRCKTSNDMVNIHKLTKNGFSNTLQFITESKLENKKFKSVLCWFFNKETDIFNRKFEGSGEKTQSNYFKMMVNSMYNNILVEIHNKILKSLKKNTSIDINKKIMSSIEKKFMSIPIKTDLYDNLEYNLYFHKNNIITPQYDTREDIFYGMDEAIPLPTYKKPKILLNVVKINLANPLKSKTTELHEPLSEIKKDSVCQHYVSWDIMTNFRKSNPNKFIDLINIFTEQYVMENNIKEFVCKSCSQLLKIRDYIMDGEFNKATNKYVIFSSPFIVNLEDLSEYSKLRGTIKNIDKMILMMSVNSNIVYFNDNKSIEHMTRRKNLTKDAIDLILINNKLHKSKIKERDNIIKKYALTKEYIDTFNFELENNIFVISSKGKDYFKNIKQNNILSYLTILLLLELNESHIGYMTGDLKGICNYGIYKKFGRDMFANLKIIINKNMDLDYIQNFPVLCYFIYNISCMLTKYKKWYVKIDEPIKDTDKTVDIVKPKVLKFNPQIQKRIIYTTIDILNSILENSSNNAHIYSVFNSKYFRKLEFFANKNILERVLGLKKQNVTVNRTDLKPITFLLEGFKDRVYEKQLYKTTQNVVLQMPIKLHDLPSEYLINNITNDTTTGKFNTWTVRGKNKYLENQFGTSLLGLEIKDDSKNELTTKFKYSQLLELSEKYCTSGEIHSYTYDQKTNKTLCTKCHKENIYKYSHKELDELKNNLEKLQNKDTDTHNNINTDSIETKKQHTLTLTLEELSSKFGKINNIDVLIEEIQKVKGINIKLANTFINLYDNTYIIDHDHTGHSLDTPIVLSDKDKKINLIKNHSFFGKDVLYYTNYKGKKTDIFYDSVTHVLLGHKVAGKEYETIKKIVKKIIINYSFYNKIKIIGYESSKINVDEKLEQIKEVYSDKLSKEQIHEIIITDILNYRLQNLKKIIYEFQRFFYRSKNNYVPTIAITSTQPTNTGKQAIEYNDIEILTHKYNKKLNHIILRDKNKKNKVFANWKDIDVIQIDSYKLSHQGNFKSDQHKTIDTSELKDDTNNTILQYIISEILKLISYNQNHIVKSNIIDYSIELIDVLFDMFNNEKKLNNFEIRKFLVILKSIIRSKQYDYNEQFSDIDLESNVVPTEEIKEQNQDKIEEDDALDMEVDYDPDLGDEPDDDGINYQSRYETMFENHD